MMPAMAWVMARGMRNRDTTDPTHRQPADPARDDEMSRLRDEVTRLRADLEGEPRSAESTGG
jgi:hypothetical protein